jgi:acyl carrier protein
VVDKQEIREFLASLANKGTPIGDSDSLITERLLDSLKIIQLIVFLEDHYKVTFGGDELIPDNLDTINAIASLLERKGVS